MPRVVQDQSHKFETDELFRKLSEDTEVFNKNFPFDKQQFERSVVLRFLYIYREKVETKMVFTNDPAPLISQPVKITEYLNFS